MAFPQLVDPHDQLDLTARAGLLIAAAMVGRSYQPGLLTRSTVNQAVITGVSAAAGYGGGVAGHALLSGVARRLLRGRRSLAASLAVDAAAVVAGAGVAAALRWREHESHRRAVGRLAAGGIAAAGAAGLGAAALEQVPVGDRRPAVTAAGAAATAACAWLATRPWAQEAGSYSADGQLEEDATRSVAPGASAAIGIVVGAATFGAARGEAALARGWARAATAVMGGSPVEHRTAGRLGAVATSYFLGWLALGAATNRMTSGGEGIEAAHSTPPGVPQVTGSADSGIPWGSLSREGRRWLSMTLTPEGISAVTGSTEAKQPIRVYASLQSAPTPEERVAQLLHEIDRTGALDRSVLAIFSPTGSGYVNYVACETLEYLTGGDCASAAIQYSVLPSSMSLGKVTTGVNQTRMLFDGLIARLRDRDPADRPRLLLFGESLGSQVSQEVFRNTWLYGLEAIDIEASVWIGTPAATVWRNQLTAGRDVAEVPPLGPGDVYVTRCLEDWHGLAPEEQQKVRHLLLQNGDDPIPKFDGRVAWRRPAWLGPVDRRPPGSPPAAAWTPVTTFVGTFFDMANALTPVPGVFQEGGHDYRAEVPAALSTVWRLPATEKQWERIDWALRIRERAWEVHRRWSEAAAAKDAKTAQQGVLDKLTAWQGRPASAGDVQHLLEIGLQPTPSGDLEAL